jgi:hypothetical protein
MGVAHLWQSLGHSGAVEAFSGATPQGHARLLGEVQGSAVAVDLSTWIMQAATQPALQEHYATPTARALSVVLSRTVHWLRHGCLPVFVIEGRTPPEKLERLKERFAASAAGGGGSGRQAGNNPFAARGRGNAGAGAGGCNSGNGGNTTTNNNNNNTSSSSRLDAIGRAVRELLDALGVPHVQAVGEAEATCAALSACGWVSAAATLDVDALLFGAQAVWRHVHLPYDNPPRAELVLCRMSSVRRALGLREGGQAALVAVAQLAGGDYHVQGASRVGDALALTAVRALLAGQESDEGLSRALAEALERGPDPALAALTKCTGCRTCGHESGGQGSIKRHALKGRTAGCEGCGTLSGCVPQHLQQRRGSRRGAGGVVASSGSGRLGPLGQQEQEEAAVVLLSDSEEEQQQPGDDDAAPTAAAATQEDPDSAPAVVTCGCRFHASADARTLNRVVARALATPGFRERARRALAAYARQTQEALSAVLEEYGVPGHSAAEAAAALAGDGGAEGGAGAAGAGAADAAAAAEEARSPPTAANQRQQPPYENVFRWRHRPDVDRVAAIMSRHCGGNGGGNSNGGSNNPPNANAGDWWSSRAAARLRLLPLLLEWDLRQGPQAFRTPSSRRAAGGVQFRPTAIRKVSTRGYAQGAGLWGSSGGATGAAGGGGDGGDEGAGPSSSSSPARAAAAAAAAAPDLHPPGGWRYILEVERIVELGEEEEEEEGDDEEDEAGDDDAAARRQRRLLAREDLRTDRAWLSGTLRVREAAAAATTAAGSAPSSPAAALLATQPQPLSQSQQPQSPPLGSAVSTPQRGRQQQQQQQQRRGMAAAAAAGSSGPSLYAEHRTVRRALVDALWPELSGAFAAKRLAAAGQRRARGAAAAAARRAKGGASGVAKNSNNNGSSKPMSSAVAAVLAAARQEDEEAAEEAEARAALAAAERARASSRGKISHYFSPSPSPSKAKRDGETGRDDGDSPLAIPSLAQRLQQLRAGGGGGGSGGASGSGGSGGGSVPPPPPPLVSAESSPAKRVRMGVGATACYDVLLGEMPSASPAKKQQQKLRRSLFSAAAAGALPPRPPPAALAAASSPPAPPPARDVIDLTQHCSDDDNDMEWHRMCME